MENKNIYDLTIIGAGPSGITAAIYAKRAGLNLRIIEKGPIGGQVISTNEIENYPGFAKISGFMLAMELEKHLNELEIKCDGNEVVLVEKENNLFKVTLDNKEVIYSKTIVSAQGARPRSLKLENEEKFLANGISFCATCDGAFYRNQEVIVVGGGNSAIDEAYFLSNICKKVTILQNLDKLTADQKGIDLLKNKDNITVVLSATVKKYLGENQLEGVVYQKDGKDIELKADGVFLFVGMKPNTELFTKFNVLNDYGYFLTDEKLMTKEKGLFAIGDIRQKHIRQIVTAMSDGAVVVNSILEYLK